MIEYTSTFGLLENMVNCFIRTASIDQSQLTLFDGIIEKSNEDSFRVLNNSYISLNEQRTLFGAFRNINLSLKIMKNRLKYAYKLNENPITAENALEIMPLYLNLSKYLDDYLDTNEINELEKICLFSRNLYKKAHQLGFYQDSSSQLREIGVSTKLVDEFIDEFTAKISEELELDEEIGFEDESTD